ncbi:MAG: hypothetical protein AAFY84_04980, partial [Pseudomonadota bacterium]
MVSVLAAACFSAASAENEIEFLEMGELFVLLDGDGDPEFWHEKKTIKLIDSFERPVNFGQDRRPIYRQYFVFEITSGQQKGQFILLSSRIKASIDVQLAKQRIASVVVELYPNYDGHLSLDTENMISSAMTVMVPREMKGNS